MTVEEFLRGWDEALSQGSAQAIDRLRGVAQREPAPGQIFACLEWYYGDCELNYNVFSVKTGRNGEKLLDVDNHPLYEDQREFAPVVNEYLEQAFSQHQFSQADGLALGEAMDKRIFDWISKCWKEAGGARSKLPTFFCFEKEFLCRDLFSGKPLSEEETAQSLGHEVKGRWDSFSN